MAIKSDKWIINQAQENQLISPFASEQIRELEGEKIVSYGVSSYGYDVRCSDEFKIFTNTHSSIVDPKNFDPKSFIDVTAEQCIIPPNSFALARTVEYFKIPRSILTLCLEFSNTTNLPAKIYANEGVAQMIFFESDQVCKTSYKDRGGKYQGQTGVTLPKT